MALPLRIYLLVRYGADAWSVAESTDLDTVVATWNARPSPGQTNGVLHVGFGRPSSEPFEPLAARYPGRLLLTAAAMYTLPAGFDSETTPVGMAFDRPVFLATTGWGAPTPRPAKETAVEPQNGQSTAPSSAEGWLAALLNQHADLGPTLNDAGIVDDVSYLVNEAQLEQASRHLVGLFRFEALIDGRQDDPCAMIHECPPWLLERSLKTIGLTVRISNAFKRAGLEHVRDLQPYSVDKLFALPNFGRRSVADLRDALRKALDDGPRDIRAMRNQAQRTALLSQIEQTLESFGPRERDILVRRMGLDCEQKTLQEIGDTHDLTRERVRQIEAKGIERIRRDASWGEFLVATLERLVAGREFPLPVQGLEAVEPWFEGVGRAAAVFEYVLTAIYPSKWAVVHIDDADYVGRLSQDQWKHLVAEACRTLASGSEQRWSEEHCRALISTLLKEPVSEFRSLLWKHATKYCHFVSESDGMRVLASYGRGAEQIVEAVLQESDRPLHFMEIATRASQRAGRPIDVRRTHAAAGIVGLLLGRGTFGARKHLALADADFAAIREEVEEIVFAGPDGRQWHTSELVSLLAERGIPHRGDVDKYGVDVVLKESTVLRRLGRMVWAKGDANLCGSNVRIDLRQAIVDILTKAGGPLRAIEIRQRLVALRGINQNIVIVDDAPLVRLGHGLWGLNDRDIPLHRDQQTILIKQLVAALQSRREGIHVSELSSVVHNPKYLACTPEAMLSIATQDPRLTANASKYLYLGEWGHPRRESLIDAIKATLEQVQSPLNIDEVVRRVEGRLKRPSERTAISSGLRAIGASYEPGTETWAWSSEHEADEDELVDAGVSDSE